jgi:hypothetical protein
VRNPHTLEIHNQSFADALDRHTDHLATTPFAAEAFYREHGLIPADPEAMRLGAEASQERIVTLYRQGGLFRISVQNLYEKVCDRFDARGIAIAGPRPRNQVRCRACTVSFDVPRLHPGTDTSRDPNWAVDRRSVSRLRGVYIGSW